MFDAHFHLNYLPKSELRAYLAEAVRAGVRGGIVAGVWLSDPSQVCALNDELGENCFRVFRKSRFAREWPSFESGKDFGVFLAHGLHPTRIHDEWLGADGGVLEQKVEDDIRSFQREVEEKHDIIWAIGETGFDLSKDIVSDPRVVLCGKDVVRELHERAFDACVTVAKRFRLPLIIHTRAAWKQSVDSIESVVRSGDIAAVMIHCYSGPAEELSRLEKLGVYVSFGGVPTWESATKVRKAALAASPSLFLLETDAPDLPPEVDGARLPLPNRPSYLTKIASLLSSLRGEEERDFVTRCDANLFRYLGIGAQGPS